jgi:transcriptional regulator of acetoin/glycerol metabolism
MIGTGWTSIGGPRIVIPVPKRLRGNVTEATRENNSKLAAQINPWRETEKTEILTTITKTEGNKRLAARLLGIGQTTIFRKVNEYGMKGQFPRRRGISPGLVSKS